MTDAQGIRRVPCWPTVQRAYGITWALYGEFLKIAWCWLAILVPVCIAYVLYMPEQSIHALALKHSTQATTRPDYLSWPLQLLIALASGSIAVRWHRLLLLQEKPSGALCLRFDRLVVNYLLLTLLIYLISAIPGLVMALAALAAFINAAFGNSSPSGLTVLAIVLCAVVAFIYTIPYVTCLTVLLPARALATPLPLKEGIRRARASFWSLFWGAFLCILPFFPIAIVMMICGKIYSINMVAIHAIQLLLSVTVILPVYLSFLSLSYNHLFEEKPGGFLNAGLTSAG